jgi:hypothetical protein
MTQLGGFPPETIAGETCNCRRILKLDLSTLVMEATMANGSVLKSRIRLTSSPMAAGIDHGRIG